MKSLDMNNSGAAIQQAIKDNDAAAFAAAIEAMGIEIAENVRQEYEGLLAASENAQDVEALRARGVRQLTSKETAYYNKLLDAMRAPDPKQALTNVSEVLPRTVIDSVFEELQTAHPLLSRINFTPTGGAVKFILNANGYQAAAWGQLCAEIVQELLGGFDVIDSTLFKLSAFLPVCKAMLELGPSWLDRYVRQMLYEAFSNGLEAAIVAGDGNNMPIGMNRQVGPGVTVTGGVYPTKTPIAVTDLSPGTMGNLLSLMAVDQNGKPRQVRDVILVVNPQDYFQRIMPATTIMAPDGTYRNDVLPYPISVIQSFSMPRGQAVIGMAYRYFAAAGTNTDGKIEYSDHYQFIEDNRVYVIKGYANGMPMDNNAFQLLDISEMRPAVWKVEQVSAGEVSSNATLAALRIGALTLSPAFDSVTETYAAVTTNASNTITATPADAGAQIDIDVNGATITNGTAATWVAGANTVTITVTAADGDTQKTYVVTVTKS